jgi:hypothetical protein
MINNNSTYGNNENAQETNSPLDGANASSTMDSLRNKLPAGAESKFREYGKKSMAPLVDLLNKYQGDITPYFNAVGKGLQGAVDALSTPSSNLQNVASNAGDALGGAIGGSVGEEISSSTTSSSSEADIAVAGWFREAANWFNGAREKISSGNTKDLLNFVEAEGRRSPGLLFSSSYVAGLVLGRMGRHMGRQRAMSNASTTSTTSTNTITDPSATTDQWH